MAGAGTGDGDRESVFAVEESRTLHLTNCNSFQNHSGIGVAPLCPGQDYFHTKQYKKWLVAKFSGFSRDLSLSWSANVALIYSPKHREYRLLSFNGRMIPEGCNKRRPTRTHRLGRSFHSSSATNGEGCKRSNEITLPAISEGSNSCSGASWISGRREVEGPQLPIRNFIILWDKISLIVPKRPVQKFNCYPLFFNTCLWFLFWLPSPGKVGKERPGPASPSLKYVLRFIALPLTVRGEIPGL